jgi:hypothetical protein
MMSIVCINPWQNFHLVTISDLFIGWKRTERYIHCSLVIRFAHHPYRTWCIPETVLIKHKYLQKKKNTKYRRKPIYWLFYFKRKKKKIFKTTCVYINRWINECAWGNRMSLVFCVILIYIICVWLTRGSKWKCVKWKS